MPKQMDPRLAYDDPLLASRDFFYSRTLFPLGFPLRVESNSQHILRAASETWGYFPQAFQQESLVLSLGVSENQSDSLPRAPSFRSRGHLLSIVSDPENFIVCDFASGYQFGWVTEAAAKDPAFLYYFFLDVSVLTTIQQKYLAPIHGACVADNGSGIVLCGPSSAGKSTLAYACSRAGWTYVSDDATFLVRSESARSAIGNCHTIRFRENTKRFFPELFHLPSSTRPNGTQRVQAFTRDLPIQTIPACRLEHVVFLNRNQTGGAQLQPFDKEWALDWFTSFTSYGAESVRHEQQRAYESLLTAPVWELSYSDLEDAVSLLNDLRRPG
ncbi:MAG: HPr kinase/phosphorylase [Bryobacteraceae bacterium]